MQNQSKNIRDAIRKESYVKTEEIVEQMTLEEKVSQVLYKAPSIPRLNVSEYNWWNEALHGVARAGTATVFPQAIGLAATFNPKLINKMADIISTEARAKFNVSRRYDDIDIYKGLTYWSPNVDVFIDPRWGRGHESYGEDPYLIEALATAYVNGLQGSDSRYIKAAACLKHLACYGGPEGQRHHININVNKKDLSETYLPVFKNVINKTDVAGVMTAYHRLNGIPCSAHKELIQDFLRNECGFEGYVVTDCWAIDDIYSRHKVAETKELAAAMVMEAGVDLNCGEFYKYLPGAIEQGLVSEEKLDESVKRLYSLRYLLGEFRDEEDNPYSEISGDKINCDEHREFNLSLSRKVPVLLKNNGVLPIESNPDKQLTIGIIGPNAENVNALLGNYHGTPAEVYTPLAGIRKYVNDNNLDVKILYSEGCHIYEDSIEDLADRNDRISEVKYISEEADIVIACFGIDASLEGEQGDQGNQYASGDKPDLEFPGLQAEVLDTIYEYANKVVLLNFSGSALYLDEDDKKADAIMQCWYPGPLGGLAIAELLFGDFSPSGKLPISFYNRRYELPDNDDFNMENRTYRFCDKDDVLYPFGFGLSYTTTAIKNCEISKNSYTLGNDYNAENVIITIKGELHNEGEFDVEETVQVYVKTPRSDGKNPELKYVEKLPLEANSSLKFEVELPEKVLLSYDEEGNEIINEGEYLIYVGTCQPMDNQVGKNNNIFKINVSKGK